MRRLARLLFALCTALSLAMCVAVCVLWVLSYRTQDSIYHERRNANGAGTSWWRATSEYGHVLLAWGSSQRTWQGGRPRPFPDEPDPEANAWTHRPAIKPIHLPLRRRYASFEYVHVDATTPDQSTGTPDVEDRAEINRPRGPKHVRSWHFVAPHWAFAIAFCLLPVAYWIAGQRARKRSNTSTVTAASTSAPAAPAQ